MVHLSNVADGDAVQKVANLLKAFVSFKDEEVSDEEIRESLITFGETGSKENIAAVRSRMAQ